MSGPLAENRPRPPATRIALSVLYLDDQYEPADLEAGQREMAAFEMQSFGCGSTEAMRLKPVLFLRFLAYEGLRRTRRLPRNDRDRSMSWDEWNDVVDEVLDNEDEEMDTPADPTRAAQPLGD